MTDQEPTLPPVSKAEHRRIATVLVALIVTSTRLVNRIYYRHFWLIIAALLALLSAAVVMAITHGSNGSEERLDGLFSLTVMDNDHALDKRFPVLLYISPAEGTSNTVRTILSIYFSNNVKARDSVEIIGTDPHCSYGTSISPKQELQRIYLGSASGKKADEKVDSYEFPLVNSGSSTSTTIYCYDRVRPKEVDFSTRAMTVLGGIAGYYPGDDPQPSMLVDFTGFLYKPDFRITGGFSPSRMSSYLVGNTEVRRYVDDEHLDFPTVFWRDSKRQDIHDMALLIVGSLLGLSGACFVEWMKSQYTKA